MIRGTTSRRFPTNVCSYWDTYSRVNGKAHPKLNLNTTKSRVRHSNHQNTTTPPQTQTTWKNENRAKLRKQKWLVYIHKDQKSFRTPPHPKNSLIEPKKAQNYPKKAKNKKSENKKILQNKSYQSWWVNPKKHFWGPSPKNSPIRPQKAQNDPKKAKK